MSNSNQLKIFNFKQKWHKVKLVIIINTISFTRKLLSLLKSNYYSIIKNSWLNSFSSLTKTSTLLSSVFSYLNIVIFAFKCRLNSQSFSFLAKIFVIPFQVTMAFLTKLNFSRSFKVFVDPWKIFPCLRKIIFLVHGKIS